MRELTRSSQAAFPYIGLLTGGSCGTTRGGGQADALEDAETTLSDLLSRAEYVEVMNELGITPVGEF